VSQPIIRVLVVDDESIFRRALRDLLLGFGFQVIEASRGEEALQLLRSGIYEAVLLDVKMPGIGGIETLPASAPLPVGCRSSCSPCATRKRIK
jgi:CheY-like chemotaxis protein